MSGELTAVAAAEPTRYRQEDGGMMPVMLFIIASLLIGGVTFFGVGTAASARAGGQTAADAAALAGAGAVRDAMTLTFGDGMPVCEPYQPVAYAAARDYASRNGAEVRAVTVRTSLEHLCEVDVWVLSNEEATQAGPISPNLSDEVARGGVVHAKAASQGIGLPTGFGGIGGGGWSQALSIDDPQQVMTNLVGLADQIDQAALPYVWGGGHGHDPVPTNLPGYDCSGAVSMLLQNAGISVPTSTSAGFLGMDRMSGVEQGEGEFLTLWTYAGDPGHVWLEINGNGWGTHSNSRAGGPGWGHRAKPTPSEMAQGATPYHFTELEQGLDSTFVNDLIGQGIKQAAGFLGGPLGAAGPRLIDAG
ncbi:NlpC/P60 family protein [Nitriliruptoraceae bacterium ZYF776]|nr:NlpC/P60 family protein [Profundirhabdus halotolerans]